MSQSTSPIRSASSAQMRRAVASCAVGQVFELFDFAVYGFLAAALGRAFFPSSDPMTSLLSTFATFGVGFLTRPLGAVVIGHYGDRHGRKRALVFTIGVMALATGCTGLIPGYATIGVWAPILLLACRLLQGFSTGGEWGGSVAFLVEYAPPQRRGLFASIQQCATAVGVLSASLAAGLARSSFDDATFFAWGWRLPFLLGFILGPIGYYLRTMVAETPIFTRQEADGAVPATPLREALTTYRGQVLAAFGVNVVGVAVNYVLLVFMTTFAAQQLHIDLGLALYSTTLANIIYGVLTPFIGAASDRYGRKPFFYACSIASVVFAYPAFLLLTTIGTIWGLVLVQAVAGVVLALCTGVLPSMLAEMFPTRVRYSAISIGYGFAATIFGGFAPFIATFLVTATGSPMAPSAYLIVAGLISAVALTFVRIRPAGSPLP
jgi:MHS family proline/betaine transporter-like MFS transporter